MPKHNTDPNEQPELLGEDHSRYELTPEEEKEKEIYSERLQAYLRDPEFRMIEGFPIGEDEDILALSDPPYFTACPNPFMDEIIEKWQQERAALRKELGLPDDSQDNGNGLKIYHREPFASDVSEGKNDPIYNAHSYHTKVPHKAVMRYILHYTDPGDVVLDGFCGTGMTGVAAQLCGYKNGIESLGYTVQRNGTVLDEYGEPISKLGSRKAVLVDLSPAATFIAYNYNIPVDGFAFEKVAYRLLHEVEKECGWMYETWHPHCDDVHRVKGRINYTVWSDVFVCPNCGDEIVFWDVAVNHEINKVKDKWDCPTCGTKLAKNIKKGSDALKVERMYVSYHDGSKGGMKRQAKQVPVLISYQIDKNRFSKRPDSFDLSLLQAISEKEIFYWYPSTRIDRDIDLWYERDYRQLGVYSIDDFYTDRALMLLSTLRNHIIKVESKRIRGYLLWSFTSVIEGSSRMNRERPGGMPSKLSGTLYIGALIREINIIDFIARKVKRMSKLVQRSNDSVISAQSSSYLKQLKLNSIDYIFTDPPFGSNIIYSDLSILWESWLNLFTNTEKEAVIHRRKKRGGFTIDVYRELMIDVFRQYYSCLKPGRWMTVEFHNTKNAVWNAIQESIISAGFMIADVRTLDKKQGSFKQVTTTAAVKQDLIISAYKPRTIFERQFLAENGSLRGAWAFIRQHLDQLPIPPSVDGIVETLAERQNYLLYDRMLAFHIMRGLAVPLSASEFYQGLDQRYLERDGMYFTPDQAAEYDKRRLGAEQVEQLALFVNDEKSAIRWLRQELDPGISYGPQTYQDLQPKFLRELHQARYEALPELREMLEDNFLQDEEDRWYLPNPEKQADLEALRQKSLLREFNEYLKSKGRLKVFRSEAVRAGFSYYWKERDYDTILRVADRLPPIVLEEDQQLLMYVHNAGLRQSEQPKQERLM